MGKTGTSGFKRAYVDVTVVTSYVEGLLPRVVRHRSARVGTEITPDYAHLVLDNGPLSDVRAVRMAPYLSGRLHEDAWIVVVAAFNAEIAYDTLDEALRQLCVDVQTGDILPDAHPGSLRLREPSRLRPPIEALMHHYHEQVLRDVENRHG